MGSHDAAGRENRATDGRMLADADTVQQDRALDVRTRGDLHVAPENHAAADDRVSRHPGPVTDECRRHDPSVDLCPVDDPRPVSAEQVPDTGANVSLKDVEGSLQVSVGGADIQP